ncbi:hypothetical protein WN51_07446 [Melipona quadrifasciata]|uniref:Uncharacterized protein n=1 Tax=Melipona quadrifasciata TaxID=166423 RepID=A0A0M9A735_9HYME|nr:hypothetical protein WN51_07446 [Melipona quadrifasciata]
MKRTSTNQCKDRTSREIGRDFSVRTLVGSLCLQSRAIRREREVYVAKQGPRSRSGNIIKNAIWLAAEGKEIGNAALKIRGKNEYNSTNVTIKITNPSNIARSTGLYGRDDCERRPRLLLGNPENWASSDATLMQRKLAIGRFGHVIREGAWGRPRAGVALPVKFKISQPLVYDSLISTILPTILVDNPSYSPRSSSRKEFRKPHTISFQIFHNFHLLTLLVALARGLLLLHPRVFGHVDGRIGDPVRIHHGVVARMMGSGTDGSSGAWGMLKASVAGQLGQRGHELRHGGLAVDEACLRGAACRYYGLSSKVLARSTALCIYPEKNRLTARYRATCNKSKSLVEPGLLDRQTLKRLRRRKQKRWLIPSVSRRTMSIVQSEQLFLFTI